MEQMTLAPLAAVQEPIPDQVAAELIKFQAPEVLAALEL
jgi:hypothetical protein